MLPNIINTICKDLEEVDWIEYANAEPVSSYPDVTKKAQSKGK